MIVVPKNDDQYKKFNRLVSSCKIRGTSEREKLYSLLDLKAQAFIDEWCDKNKLKLTPSMKPIAEVAFRHGRDLRID